MELQRIGFYTLSDKRADTASSTSRLMRCELVLTGRCNFKCPYCRRVGGSDLPPWDAQSVVLQWAGMGLYAIRFSGGEPTLYPGLEALVRLSADAGIERIAISTNGSAPLDLYRRLIDAGVNDLSVSLDACCAEDNLRMTGGIKGAWETVTSNIQALAKLTYLTVGVVLTDENAPQLGEIISFADSLGVSDIRIIPAAQNGDRLRDVSVPESLLAKYPILRYRVANMRAGRPVRGLGPQDADRCGLVLDDMAVNGGQHYPCIIYMREGGSPIGKMGPDVRKQREVWANAHDVMTDPICRKNCLDVCRDYNARLAASRVQPV
jgi:MoaA/NifB/PqqE/SkfB family radical SAM enzyme